VNNDITSTMNEQQKEYYKQSVIDFEKILKPFLMDKIENALDVHITTDVDLDREKGIDCRIYVLNNNKIEGFYVAYKMQKVFRDWETICIRYSRASGRKTEFTKQIEMLGSNEARPQIHMHFYADYNGNMLVCYAVKTDLLIEWAGRHEDLIERKYKHGDSFLAVKVSDLRKAQIPVAELRPDNGRLRLV